jgi:5-carboxyvanillate decarboxylase
MTSASSYRRIACEEAFQVPEILEALRKLYSGAPDISSGPLGGPVVPLLLDIGAGRIRGMDEAGIDMQILSLVSPGVQNFDARTAVSMARLANDRLSDAVRTYPTRFAGLASFAPQDPVAAAKELERAVTKLGLHGALVNSHTHGEYLDDEKFWPIFEAAEALGIPIYIHPREPAPSMAAPLSMPGFTIGWGFAVEASTHALRLIAAGVFDRFPRLKIVLGHMGEGIPFMLDRIDNRYAFETALFPPPRKLKRLPGEYFRDHFFITTSGMNFHAPLRATIETLGVERVLFAVDFPFDDQRTCVDAIESMPLTVEERQAICETNACKVFGLRECEIRHPAE